MPVDQPHFPATAPPGIKRPSWFKGDKAAFQSSVRADRELKALTTDVE